MADQIDALRLAEAIAARLCHDLSGPVGSLNQALELVAADLPPDHEALALARAAAADLSRCLRWRRAAWAPDGPALDGAELAAIVQDRRTKLDLGGLAPATIFRPPMARAILNVLLLAHEGLPRGGRVALNGAAADVIFAIDGPDAAWPAALFQCLTDLDAAIDAAADPRTMQAPLTVLLARGLALGLSMILPPGRGTPLLRLSES